MVRPAPTPSLLIACTVWLSFSCAASAHDHAVLRGRLVFADHEKPVVRILDLDTGEVTHAFDLPKANPVLAIAEDGRHVVIKTGDTVGTVRFLDSGVVRESHGDHDDVEKAPPKLLDLAVTGDKPAHVVSQNGQIAIFYDGERPWERRSDPKVVLVDLRSLVGKQPKWEVWKSPGPQHGIAVPLGGRRLLLSLPNETYANGEDRTASSRPDGFRIVDARGKPDTWKVLADLNKPAEANASCRLFHGYASVRNVHAFGCHGGEGGGLLVLERSGKSWAARKVAYPDERRVSTIKGGSGQYLVGNLGQRSPYTALLRIDPAGKALAAADVMPVPGDQPACRFELSADGKRLANLTPDGKLRVYEIAPSWKEVASFDAVPAFDCTYGATTPTPDLAMIGPNAHVSDPVNGRIREYNLNTLKQGLDLPVDGKPTTIAGGAFGG